MNWVPFLYLGVRLARIFVASDLAAATSSSSLIELPFDLGLGRVLALLLPACLYRLLLCVRLTGPGRLRTDPVEAAQDAGCRRRLYYGEVLATRRDCRRSGLGRELIVRSLSVARSSGCDAAFVFATGNYSGKIFQSMGFRVRLTLRSLVRLSPPSYSYSSSPGPPHCELLRPQR